MTKKKLSANVEFGLAKSKPKERIPSLLASIVESSDDAVIGTTLDGIILSWNKAAVRIYGYSADEVMGRSVSVLAPEGRRDEVPQMLERLQRGERIENHESARVRKDGKKIDVALTVSPIRDSAGRIVAASTIARDITERKRGEEEIRKLNEELERRVVERTGELEKANKELERSRRRDATALGIERTEGEQALRDSEERYRLLFESNPQPMWVFDVDTLAFLTVNDAAVHHYGYSRDEFLSMTIEDIRPAEDVSAKDREEMRIPGKRKHRKKDGTDIDVEITTHELDFDGKHACLALATDVTERNRLEEQLRQSQKMEAVGSLASGIAHDFNNLLTAILGYSHLLLSVIPEENRPEVEEIKRAGERAALLIEQLLAFSRKQVIQPQVLDLNVLVDEAYQMLKRIIGEQVDLVAVLDPNSDRIKADRGQVQQVILNLAVNARDAVPKGGKITIETKNVELDEAYARQHSEVTPGPYVMLAVSDTGIGMDGETQSRIFEPFFTTKEPGKGTGLGLSTVYGIVRQSGGHISVYSKLNHGTIFKVYFPLSPEISESVGPSKVSKVALGGSEVILLVEDEPAVRDLTSKILASNGYTVLKATDVEDALRICTNRDQTIHLIISDVVMPKMSGPKLVQMLEVLRPEAQILFMSGYSEEAMFVHGTLEKRAMFLRKPFTPEALLRKVREAVDLSGL